MLSLSGSWGDVMDVDMSFFDAVVAVWSFFFGFFPGWVQAMFAVAIGLFVVVIGLKIVKFLKDLLWPF